MANKVNPLTLAGLTRNLHRTAKRIVSSEYAPQLADLKTARQQSILQGKSQEDRARAYGTQLQANYAETLKNAGLVQDPANPLAAGGQATTPSNVTDWKGYLASLSAAGGMSGGEQAGQIAVATDRGLTDLESKRHALIAQRGGEIAKTENELGQQAFTNYATLQGLNLKSDSLAQQLALAQSGLNYKYDALGQAKDIANTNAGLSQQRIDATLTGQQLAHQDRLAAIAARNGGFKGLSPTQKRALQKANAKIRSGIQTGVDDIIPYLLSYEDKDGKQTFVDKDKSPNWVAIRAALNKRLGNDGDVVNAVVNLYSNKGYLSPKYIAALKRRHIGVPKEWLPPNSSGLGHPSTTSNGGGAGNYGGHG